MIELCCEYLSVRCIWLYVFIMSRTRFRVNPHSIECGFTLKRVRDMIKTYSQMHRTDKYSQHSSIIWPAWLNGWVFVYELSGCGFESSCSHFTFRFRACFEQGVPWHSGNYRVWIHSETRTWHDKNIQLKLFVILYKKQKNLTRTIIKGPLNSIISRYFKMN